MNLRVEAVCDIGCVRANNQDMVLSGDIMFRDDQKELTLFTRTTFIAGVADGMGGHQAGELASEFVLKELRNAAQMIPPELDSVSLTEWINQLVHGINERLSAYGQRLGFAGLGTTFAGLLGYEGRFYILHVGDSRVYRFRGGLLAQLTDDHSYSSLLDDPSIPQNQLANSFGGGSDKIFIDVAETSLFTGDQLLICSDGLSNELSAEELETYLQAGYSAALLTESAKLNGGNDNISCIRIIFDLPV